MRLAAIAPRPPTRRRVFTSSPELRPELRLSSPSSAELRLPRSPLRSPQPTWLAVGLGLGLGLGWGWGLGLGLGLG